MPLLLKDGFTKEETRYRLPANFWSRHERGSSFTAIHVMLDGKRNGFKIEKSSPSQQLFDNSKAAINAMKPAGPCGVAL